MEYCRNSKSTGQKFDISDNENPLGLIRGKCEAVGIKLRPALGEIGNINPFLRKENRSSSFLALKSSPSKSKNKSKASDTKNEPLKKLLEESVSIQQKPRNCQIFEFENIDKNEKLSEEIVSIRQQQRNCQISEDEITDKNEKSLKESVSIQQQQRNCQLSEVKNIDKNEKPLEESVSIQQQLKNCLISEIDNINKDANKNICLWRPYPDDIYAHLIKLEDKYTINAGFLSKCAVTAKMRSVVIDWLVSVQVHHILLDDTLHHAVSIIDRYLQVNYSNVDRKNFQLVGSCALFIGCKYEEVFHLEVKDLIYLCDSAYSREEILAMEVEILQKLNFSLGRPISLQFLKMCCIEIKCSKIVYTVGKYILELALLDYSLAHINPSCVAAATLFLSICVTARKISKDYWTLTLENRSTYKLSDIIPVVNQLASCILQAPQSKFQEVTKKYSSNYFLNVSHMEILRPSAIVLNELLFYGGN